MGVKVISNANAPFDWWGRVKCLSGPPTFHSAAFLSRGYFRAIRLPFFLSLYLSLSLSVGWLPRPATRKFSLDYWLPITIQLPIFQEIRILPTEELVVKQAPG